MPQENSIFYEMCGLKCAHQMPLFFSTFQCRIMKKKFLKINYLNNFVDKVKTYQQFLPGTFCSNLPQHYFQFSHAPHFIHKLHKYMFRMRILLRNIFLGDSFVKAKTTISKSDKNLPVVPMVTKTIKPEPVVRKSPKGAAVVGPPLKVAADKEQLSQILMMVKSIRNGDFSVKLDLDDESLLGDIAEVLNDINEMITSVAKGDREKCLVAATTDYIAKPVDTDHLLSVMHKWLTTFGEKRAHI